jgi:phytoene synthase
LNAEAAYEHCAVVTRTQARNFHYGIRLLPPDKRRAMCAIYALARRIDDIGDDADVGPSEPDRSDAAATERRLAALSHVRDQIRGLGDDTSDPVLVALRDAVSRFPIPVSAFLELVDGVEMDLVGTRYDTFDALVVYCRRVAGSIGRLSLGVFGSRDMPRAQPLADTLGVALQLTNILRDLAEDTAAGRCYLPAEDLRRFEVTLGSTQDPARLAALVRFQAERARQWYADGLTLLDLLDRRSAACVGAMAGIYARLLRRITAEPTVVLAGRLSLPAWEKAYVAARSLAGAAA